MRKRKYRRRYRRRTTTMRRRRRRMMSRGGSTEIKFYTGFQENKALKLAITPPPGSDVLYGEQNYLSNILSDVVQGAGFGERIGSKIFVMSISVRMHIWACPSTTDYNVGPFLTRHIWHNSPNTAGAVVPSFFLATPRVNFIHYPDRKVYTIHRDKLYPIGPGLFDSNIGGPTRAIVYNIPVNRYVTFTLQNKVKEDYNVYSMAILTATTDMGDGTNNGKQIGCYNLTYRIYFKDA